MSATAFHLPDLGEGLKGAEIVAWHVTIGDHVVEGQPLLSVETDKAVVEIPAPESGHIGRLHGSVGERIKIGDLLVEFGDAVGDRGAVVGKLPQSRTPKRTATPRKHVQASPKARQRARELGIDLASITPRGEFIQVADVELALSSASPHVLGGVRRAMAQRMADAHTRVVPSTVTDEAEITGWSDATEPLPRLIRAISRACQAEPLLNARFDDKAMTLVPQESVNLGIATATDDGLFVPVLKDVSQRDPADLAKEWEDLQFAVQARRIRPEALRGQTITLSNFGAVCGLHAEMVVVPPQVAIVGAGRIFQRLLPGEEGPLTGRILPLSVTIDHRVITGVEACRFLAALVADLEQTN